MRKLIIIGYIAFFYCGYLAAGLENENTFDRSGDYWIKICDSINNCGYADSLGNIKIALGKYNFCFTDTMKAFAIVYNASNNLVAINRKEDELFQVYSMDNGPDYFRQGMFRIVKDNKIGFANPEGEIVIVPQFGFVDPFNEGLASFCENCQGIKNGEYSSIENGFWGFVNLNGEIVYRPEFKRFRSKAMKRFVFSKEGNLFSVEDGKLTKVMENEKMIVVNEFIAAKKYDEALEILFAAEQNAQDDYDVLIAIAGIYKISGDFENAIKYYEKIIRLCDEPQKEIAEKSIRALHVKQ
jgi:tetratricopeptide (TPR) repeat protein